jgi:hypothetical protein
MTRQGFIDRIAQIALFFAFILLEAACEQHSTELGKIVHVAPELKSILPGDTKLEKLINGFGLLEGPVWSPGYHLFSDIMSHIIYKWHPQSDLSVFLKTGFTRTGPNGLASGRK